jgi:hypothetical protein
MSGGGLSRPGPEAQNPRPLEAPLTDQTQPAQRSPSEPGRRTGDITVSPEKALEQAPWFARLPPELRAAIRAQAQGRPPRGYEERLRQYFQNLEE